MATVPVVDDQEASREIVRDSEHAVTGFAAMIDDITAVVEAYERRHGE